MSVIVCGMDMPESCAGCVIGKHASYCPITGMGKPKGKRSIACPLLPVSEEEIRKIPGKQEQMTQR